MARDTNAWRSSSEADRAAVLPAAVCSVDSGTLLRSRTPSPPHLAASSETYRHFVRGAKASRARSPCGAVFAGWPVPPSGRQLSDGPARHRPMSSHRRARRSPCRVRGVGRLGIPPRNPASTAGCCPPPRLPLRACRAHGARGSRSCAGDRARRATQPRQQQKGRNLGAHANDNKRSRASLGWRSPERGPWSSNGTRTGGAVCRLGRTQPHRPWRDRARSRYRRAPAGARSVRGARQARARGRALPAFAALVDFAALVARPRPTSP
jgi:hypothetical protein